MAVFFLLLAILVIVMAIVYFLRRQQKRATAEYAERHQPLPPLHPPELQSEDRGSDSAAKIDEYESVATVTLPEENPDEPDDEPEAAPVNRQEIPQAPEADPPRDWLKRCQSLRSEGHLDQAMELAAQAVPQLQALEQQSLILRAKVRVARQQGDDRGMQESLDALYRVAALASYLHDAAPANQNDGPRRLVDAVDTGNLDKLSLPYEEIGHDRLRLLRKTDRQLLELLYGAPRRHISARQWHRP